VELVKLATPGARLERDVAERFAAVIPSGWAVTRSEQERVGRDLMFAVRAPDGLEVAFAVAVKRVVAPRDVPNVLAQMGTGRASSQFPVEFVVAAPFLSELTRAALQRAGVGFLDMTGNTLIRSDRPALFVSSTGALRDPSPSDDKLRGLGGRGAARAVRALVEFRTPFGIRELAERSGVALGTLSRTAELLDRDGLLKRRARGPIEHVDVSGVVRRWAKDYSISRSNHVVSALSIRGIPVLADQLSAVGSGYAATGAFGASKFAKIAPTRLVSLYVSDAREFAGLLDLRMVDSGANVWLIEPVSDVVFERVIRRDNVVCANPAQLAADLLTGPGRDPSTGQELLSWMANNDDWRS
jgi:hypothetical protein